MPKLPTFEFPTVDLGSLKIPTLPMPELSELPTVEQIADVARDAAYVGLGLVVMTGERMQAFASQLQAITEEFGAKVADLVATSVEQASAAESN